MSESRACGRQAIPKPVRLSKDEAHALGLHAADFVKETISVLKIFGASEKVCASFEFQMSSHLVKADYAHYVSQAKSFCCYGRAAHLHDKLPGFTLEFTGRFRRWFRRRINVQCPENRHLMNSLWNLKNTASPLPDFEEARLLEEHRSGMEDCFDVSPWDVVHFLNVMKPVLDRVARDAKEIFDEHYHELFTIPASNKSSYESTMDEGGEVGELVRECFAYGTHSVPDFDLGHRLRRTYEEKIFDNNPRSAFDRRLFELRCEAKGLVSARDIKKEHDKFFGEMSHHWFGEPPCSPGSPWETVQISVAVRSVVKTEETVKRFVAGFDEVVEFFPGLGAICFWELDEFLQDVDVPCEPTMLVAPFVIGTDRRGNREIPWNTEPSHFDLREWWTSSRESPLEAGSKRTVDLVSGEFVEEVVLSYPHCEELWVKYVRGIIADCEDLPYVRWADFDFQHYNHEWMVRRVVGVCEPLKLRVITVGPARQKYIGRFWQRCVHGALRKVPGFELLGRPPTTSDVDAILPGIDGQDKISSSDFKGASNHTAIRLNIALCECSSSLLPNWMQRYSLNSCLPHLLLYPLWTKLEPVWQDCGTLMGELTSFPLLSLTVAGSLAVTASETGSSLSTMQVMERSRTNGDDNMFRASDAFIDHFWVVTKRYGFQESVGKSYRHTRYANINSMNFWVAGDGLVLRERGLFCGLLAGRKKLATDIFRPGTVVTELLDSCLDGKMEQAVMKCFLSRHKKALKWNLGGRGLFIAPHLGGMGQRPPRDWVDSKGSRHVWEWRTSSTQRKVARHMYDADPYIRFGVAPRARTAPPPARAAWDVEGVPTYWESTVNEQRELYGEGPSLLNIKEYIELHSEINWDNAPEIRIRVSHRSGIPRPGTFRERDVLWTCRVCSEPLQRGHACDLCGMSDRCTLFLADDGIGSGPLPLDYVTVPDRPVDTSAPLLDSVTASRVALVGFNGPPKFVYHAVEGTRIRPRL